MGFLEIVSQTALIRWVAESDWGYPIVLTAHAIGMGLLVGIQMMFNLRVLGVGAQLPVEAIRRYFRFAWLGLIVNAISGTLLFFINYNVFLHNPAFLTKMACLAVAAIGTWLLARSIFGPPAANVDRSRILAGLCLLLWFGAITAGRLVAYTSVPEAFR